MFFCPLKKNQELNRSEAKDFGIKCLVKTTLSLLKTLL